MMQSFCFHFICVITALSITLGKFLNVTGSAGQAEGTDAAGALIYKKLDKKMTQNETTSNRGPSELKEIT